MPSATRPNPPLVQRTSPAANRSLAGASPLMSRTDSFNFLCQRSAFTLVELLIVIAIVVILAGLGFAGVQSAMKQGRKTEVRAMANQIKVAIEAYYAEYGYYPTVTSSDADFLGLITGTSATDNKRGIRFMELPAKFTNSSGIVTPRGFGTDQMPFTISVDSDFSGSITAPDSTTINQSVAVGVPDPDRTNQWIGTWK